MAVEQLEDRSLLSVDSFLLLGGINGETPTYPPAHIEIESFSFGTTNSGIPGPHTGVGTATILDFAIAPHHAAPSGYMAYELKNVLITSYQIGGSAGNDVPTESFSINFAVLQIEYNSGAGDPIPLESISYVFTSRHIPVAILESFSAGGGAGDPVPTESVSLNFAVIHIPRIGQEVVVDFLEGDPDQPIVVGCMYTVQYRESDFNFVSRLMEEEGIFYYFNSGGVDGESGPLTTNIPVSCLPIHIEPFNGFFLQPELPDLGPIDDVELYLVFVGPETGPFATPVGAGDLIPNQPPVVTLGDDPIILEGQSFSQFGTILDEDPNHCVVTVDYGDGSGEQSLPLDENHAFHLDHVYTDDGPFQVQLHVTDDDGATETDTLVVTVENARPHVDAGLDHAREGELATLDGVVQDANPFEPLVVTIDWGDGSIPQTLMLPPSVLTFQPTHVYTHDGQFNVQVTVTDDDGSTETINTQANVQNVDIIVIGPDAGSAPLVHVFDSNTHAEKFTLMPYESRFKGGVRVAVGDVNGDGVPDIITAPGAGRAPQIRVFDGNNGQAMNGPSGSFFGFDSTFLGGVSVAAGDVNGDGRADIIVGQSSGKPQIRVFNGSNGTQLQSFFAYGSSFTGGVRVAAGDVDGDGRAEIITGAGPSRGGPQVKVFHGMSGAELGSFFPYSPNFRGGVSVATGDVNGDGVAEIIVAAGPGNGPHVKVFNGLTHQLTNSFNAFDSKFSGGVNVAAGDFNGDGRADIIVAGGKQPSLFAAPTFSSIDSFFALDPKATKGLFVAGGK